MPAESSTGIAIVVSGPSGSGKTSIIKRLMMLYPDSHFSISATTRPLRGDEMDGIDYNFISAAEFLDLRDNDGLLEWADVHGLYYGTPRREVESYLDENRRVFLDVDVQGAVSIKQALPDRSRTIMVLPPDIRVLEERLRGRGTDADEVIEKRMKNALEEIGYLPQFDSVVINDLLPAAVDEARLLLDSGRCNVSDWLREGGREWLQENFGVTL
ncbi:MAG: guanylate kinase [bacterium]|nr:guanylate kinase [bacterium]